MATLDSNPASATFNCYASLAEAIDYHSMRIHNDAWNNASSTDKQKALMWASRLLNTLKWRGVRASGTQPMEFPRKGLSYTESASSVLGGFENYDSYMDMGYIARIVVTDTAVPPFLRNATCELAMWLLDSDTTAPTGTEGFKRIRIDTIDLEVLASDRTSWFTSAVRDLVWRFLFNQSSYTAQTNRMG